MPGEAERHAQQFVDLRAAFLRHIILGHGGGKLGGVLQCLVVAADLHRIDIDMDILRALRIQAPAIRAVLVGAVADEEDHIRLIYAGIEETAKNFDAMIIANEGGDFSAGANLVLVLLAVLATLWGINAFDQWGVELGKRVADKLLPALDGAGDGGVADPVTRELLAQIRRRG